MPDSLSHANSTFTPKRVFISYGRDASGAPLAAKLKASLESIGHEVWLDQFEIKRGRDWELAIEDALQNTHVVLALLTVHAVRRPDGVCLDELSFARFMGKQIVPLMVEDCRPPLSISRLQWLEMQDWAHSEERYQLKFDLIREVIEGQLLCFEGSQTALLETLRPINFEADIDHNAHGFTGREWVFDRIDSWLDDGDESQVLLLAGDPGVGKSAVVARLCQKDPRVSAWHLCVHRDTTKSDALRCVHSLAYQLSSQLPDYRERLLGVTVDEGANARTAFTQLILNPLHGLGRPSRPILIVVDALDEAERDGKNEIAAFLAEAFERTPSWLRLLVTSRPERPILNTFARFNVWRLERNDTQNSEDIRRFLQRELARITGQPTNEDVVHTLSERSEGLFLYVVLVLDEIRNGRLSVDRLDEFPRGLKAVYKQYFDRHFSDEDPEQRERKSSDFDKHQRPMLELITAAEEPLSADFITETLGWDKRRRKMALDPLGSLFLARNEQILPCHRTILEWLTDEETDLSYFIDPESGHARLADAGWARFTDAPAAMGTYLGLHLPSHLLVTRETTKLLEFLSNIEVFTTYFPENIYRYIGYWTSMYRQNGKGESGHGRCASILAESLTEWERTSPENRRNWEAYWSIGRLFFELHEHERAIGLFGTSLSHLGANSATDEDRARLYNALAEALMQLGRISDAEPYYRDALEIRRRSSALTGGLAESINNYGHVFFHQGSYDQALEQYTLALETWRLIPGGPHYGVADSLHNMAVCLDNLGRHDDALGRFEECAVTLDSLPYFDWGIPTCRNQYGNFLTRLGNFVEAERQYTLAFDLCMEVYGPEDQATIACASHLGMLCFRRAQPERAVPTVRRLVGACEQRYGRNHPKTVGTCAQLAKRFMDAGKLPEAKELFLDAASRIGQSDTSDQETDARVLQDTGMCCLHLGESSLALDYFLRAYHLWEEICPRGDEQIFVTLQYLLHTYALEGRLEEAARLASEYPSKHASAKAKDSDTYFECQQYVAKNLRDWGYWEEAEAVYTEMMNDGEAFMSRLEGKPLAPDKRIFFLAVACNELAFHSHVPQGNWDEAKKLYRRAIDLMSTQDQAVESANMWLNLYTAMWMSGDDVDFEGVRKATVTLVDAKDSRQEKGRRILDHVGH